MGPHWDSRTQAHWLITLSLSFKVIKAYLGIQPPYWGSRSHSASPLLFVPDPSWQYSRSASLPFPTLGVRIECVVTFPFLRRISCVRLFLLSSSCAAYTADLCARLGTVSAFCNAPEYFNGRCPYALGVKDRKSHPYLFGK